MTGDFFNDIETAKTEMSKTWRDIIGVKFEQQKQKPDFNKPVDFNYKTHDKGKKC